MNYITKAKLSFNKSKDQSFQMADKAPQKLFARLYMRAEGIKSQKKSNKDHKYLKRILGNILRHSTGDKVLGEVCLIRIMKRSISIEFEQNKTV